MNFERLNWKKPAGEPLMLKLAAELPPGKDITLTSLEVTGPQTSIKGHGVITPEAELKALDLNPMKSGVATRSCISVHTTGAKENFKFDATGTSLDVTGLSGGNDPERASSAPKEYHLKVGGFTPAATALSTTPKVTRSAMRKAGARSI